MNFQSLHLIEPLLRAVKAEGYETPTPIQAQAIPLVLEGKDVLACAQTGTGKTAAFALPILQLLTEGAGGKKPAPGSSPREVRVLVLTPTRELASQIADSFSNYGKALPLRTAVVYGGVAQHAQARALRQGVDILVATPGRLLDLMRQRHVHFRGLKALVLDEADQMLDMGFIDDVRTIISAVPKDRQTLFFSATMPPEIQRLSAQILRRPVRIEVTPVASTVDKIVQAVVYVEKRNKTELLIHMIEKLAVARGLVFTRTKREANRVSDELNRAGIRTDAIHGDKSQTAREYALDSVKKGKCRILVATDIAARGIDIEQVTHVFNHDVPNVPESYVHRIGRTARAGTEGTAISFCSQDEREFLSDILKLIKKPITEIPLPEGLVFKVRTRGKPARTRSPAQKLRSQGAGYLKPEMNLAGKPPEQSSTYSNPPPSPNNRKQRRKKALADKPSA